jgi:hypothetical protein
MIHTIEGILSNNAEKPRLVIGDAPEKVFSDVSELVDALKTNTVIVKCRFDRDFFAGLTAEQKQLILEQCAQLKTLTRVHLLASSIQVSLVSKILDDCSGLEVLELGHMILEGGPDDFQKFNESLKNHASLKEFIMTDFTVADASVKLDDIVKTLGGIPSLDIVKLSCKSSDAHFSGESLGPLSESPTLSSLHLSRFDLTQSHVDLIATAVEKTCHLKELCLIRVGIDNDMAVRLGAAIGINKTLERLDLSSNKIADDGCIAIADGLKANATLQFVRLWGNKGIGATGFQALSDMLDQNTTLGRLEVPMEEGGVRVKIEQHLMKNRMTKTSAIAA